MQEEEGSALCVGNTFAEANHSYATRSVERYVARCPSATNVSREMHVYSSTGGLGNIDLPRRVVSPSSRFAQNVYKREIRDYRPSIERHMHLSITRKRRNIEERKQGERKRETFDRVSTLPITIRRSNLKRGRRERGARIGA